MMGSSALDLARSNMAKSGKTSRNSPCPCGSKKLYKRYFLILWSIRKIWPCLMNNLLGYTIKLQLGYLRYKPPKSNFQDQLLEFQHKGFNLKSLNYSLQNYWL